MEITLAHSPDSDDAFMFYGLARGKVPTGELTFSHVLCDIETLNQEARVGRYDVTALSVHAYPYVAERYALMTCGGSIGDGYGPILVARERLDPERLGDRVVAVPGTLTTAFLALRLARPQLSWRVVPFERILEVVARGDADLGLVIHEGQITFAEQALFKVLDLGEWWRRETGLPLPLGMNAVRRDLGADLVGRVTGLVRQSILYGLTHRAEALKHALGFARGMDPAVADRFVGMWVNERTVDCGEDGRRAVRLLLDRGHERGVIPAAVRVDFVEG